LFCELLQVLVCHYVPKRVTTTVFIPLFIIPLVYSADWFSRCYLLYDRRSDNGQILVVSLRLKRSLKLAQFEIEADLRRRVVRGVVEEAVDLELEETLEGLQGVVPSV
jgi:hypothetical protein